ncbi:hypothetical protein ACOSP7_029529 [Xanthoceras sorbifolium]
MPGFSREARRSLNWYSFDKVWVLKDKSQVRIVREAKQNREGVVAGQPRTTQSGQYLVSDRRTSRGKPGIDQYRRIPEVDVTIKRRLFIVTSTSGIRLHWSMPGLPREVRRSLTRYCPLWVVRGCPATTPSRFSFASPKSGFEPVTYP